MCQTLRKWLLQRNAKTYAGGVLFECCIISCKHVTLKKNVGEDWPFSIGAIVASKWPDIFVHFCIIMDLLQLLSYSEMSLNFDLFIPSLR